MTLFKYGDMNGAISVGYNCAALDCAACAVPGVARLQSRGVSLRTGWDGRVWRQVRRRGHAKHVIGRWLRLTEPGIQQVVGRNAGGHLVRRQTHRVIVLIVGEVAALVEDVLPLLRKPRRQTRLDVAVPVVLVVPAVEGPALVGKPLLM